MFEVIPFDKLVEPDPRNLGFVGPITTDKLQELFRDWQIQEGVPDDVAKQVEVAQKLFVYGYFVYEFYTAASFVSILAVESALIHRFCSYYNNTFEITKKGEKATTKTLEGLRFRLRKGWQLTDDPEFRGGFKALLLWAGRKNLLKKADHYAAGFPKIRASHAHPLFQSVLTPGMAHTTVATSIELINGLFSFS